MSVAEWYIMLDITTANYYYRFGLVRKVCLELVEKEQPKQCVVPVQINQLKKETSSDELLNKVLRVVVNVNE